MKRLLIICIWCLCVCGIASAQTLIGVVRDKQTKQPIANADIYLKGTSYYTLTDSTGRFELSIRKQVNTPLIVGHLAYKTQTFNDLSALPAEILLEERVSSLSEVTVIGKVRYSQAKKMDVFRRYFLGDTPAGKACRILNEEDIELIYDSEKRELRATCSKPLHIENKYLGYEILYELNSFVVAYSRDAMVDRWLLYSMYAGSSAFKDVTPHNARMQRRRKEAYRVSSANFFKHVVSEDLDQSHWRLIKNWKVLSPQSCFEVSDTLSMKRIRVLPALEGNEASYIKPAYGDVWLADTERSAYTGSTTYGKDVGGFVPRSLIAFFTVELLVDSYGNVSPWDGVMYGGEMNEQRLGDMLPMDYEP